MFSNYSDIVVDTAFSPDDNNDNNNDHFLIANCQKALSTLQNTRLGSGLVYTQTSKIITQ